jgi:hypothetical protein
VRAARTLEPEDRTIDAWTVHCPDCASPVSVTGDGRHTACAACGTAFEAAGLPTRVGATPPPVPADPADDLVGAVLGAWRLRRSIGHGGMGRVYEAADASGRRVAVKVLARDLADDPSFARRFHREAQLLASLQHPHVVEILDQGEHDGRLWFAMEYVRGENLRRRMERGPLPVAEALRIGGEIASALAYAHGRNIVHRDLKPENVLLDEDGRVRLADFGLSRLVRREGPEATTHLTRTDVVLGTWEYMAPEQRRGNREIDARADVFALGVMLYEMLTGSLPLGRFRAPSAASADVPAGLDAVINRALAPEPRERYASAAEMRDALLEAGRSARRSCWFRRRRATPPPVPAAGGGPVDAEARRMLAHVDVLAGADKVLGVLCLLGFTGLLSFRPSLGLPWPVEVSGVVLLIAGIAFLRIGNRLSEMRPGSRESQVTASIVLVFFPPVLTAMGIYGLLVLTGERARRAFALGRKNLQSPTPVVASRVVEVPPVPRKEPPGVLLRLFSFVTLLWTVYVFFIALDARDGFEDLKEATQFRVTLWMTVAALVASLGFLVQAIRRRHRRTGVGLALLAAGLLVACTATMVSAARHVHGATPVVQRLGFGFGRQERLPTARDHFGFRRIGGHDADAFAFDFPRLEYSR